MRTGFSAHSLRGAGVSAGARMGLSADILMQYGSWRNQKTMARHYKKPVEERVKKQLGTALLDQCN